MRRLPEIYAERFADPDGRVRATFEIVWLSGWAPHASQQQPLAPGSAKARLADALGTQEISAGEKAGRSVKKIAASVVNSVFTSSPSVTRGGADCADAGGDQGIFDRGRAALVGVEARGWVDRNVSIFVLRFTLFTQQRRQMRDQGSSAGGIG